MKKRVKAWCRYWHYNVLGVLSDNEGHRNYLSVVDTLDDWFNTDAWKRDNASIAEAWIVVLDNLNKCSEAQIIEVDRLCIID